MDGLNNRRRFLLEPMRNGVLEEYEEMVYIRELTS